MQMPTQMYWSSLSMLIAVVPRIAFPWVVLLAAPGDGGEDLQSAGVVAARPDGNFVDGTQAAETQAAVRIHLADVDAGGGDHQMTMKRYC